MHKKNSSRSTCRRSTSNQIRFGAKTVSTSQSLPRTCNENFKTHFFTEEIFTFSFTSFSFIQVVCHQNVGNEGQMLGSERGWDLTWFLTEGKGLDLWTAFVLTIRPYCSISLPRRVRELKVARSWLEGSPSNLHTHTHLLEEVQHKCNCFDGT